ncbi:MAG: 2-hydroxyacid dehydrogenase [Acidobacteriota bacterium]
MIRVAYPASVLPEFLSDFPAEAELIPVSEKMEHEVEAEVWIPDPYATRAMRTWPKLRGVKLVLSLMAGTEWIPGTVGPHVTICNARGAHSVATAEWVLTAILASLKQLPLFLDIQRSENWRRRREASAAYAVVSGDQRPHHPDVMLEELTGKTVLMVGHGSIGKEIERMLEPFRVQMVRVARSARTEPKVHPVSELTKLLPRADVVVLILPYSAETHWLIDKAQLEAMRQGTLLVNAARGAIVNTDALVEALQLGRIRAALDVTDPEPLPEGHPLWSCPNLLITPHVAGSSPEFAPHALRVAAGELRRYLAGEPLQNVVQAGV